ncbi:LamG domain-containing protein [Dactylosporangium sp. CS-033363]|uniref:LamG domain-containing protein n=1 Tax=Dactylosporangium sp. CS-033363 TaxID=3239935 RepID=UPI003D8D1B94
MKAALLVVLLAALAAMVPGAFAAFSAQTGNTGNSFTAAATFPTYSQAVLADAPLFYHRLADSTGTTSLADSSGNARAATASVATANTTYTMIAGPSVGGSGIYLDGGGIVSTDTPIAGPNVFSLELWFRTSGGGKLIGFGNQPAAPSTSYDRHVYVDSGGQLTFGIYEGGAANTIRTASAYNNGSWHQVVATIGGGTMNLYVDGALQATGAGATPAALTGYWRVGGDALYNSTWPNVPAGGFITATVDEVAIYPVALSAAQVSAHYSAASAAAYTAAVQGDAPYSYWKFGEGNPTNFTDSSGNGHTAENHLGPALTPNQAGALPAPDAANPSMRFDGRRAQVYNAYQMTTPAAFTEEVWFKTTTKIGGKLMGFGNATIGASSNYDRHVYIRNDGKLGFGIYNGGYQTVTSAAAYNDGAWHYVAASMGAGGQRLYVDGVLVGQNTAAYAPSAITGYWHLGYDALATAWTSQVTSPWYTGWLDEWAVYDTQLTTSQIAVHYAATK